MSESQDNFNVFITSDTFFGRSEYAEYRGYTDAKEMDADIISRWNEVVKPSDTVYHLGNFAWDPITASEVLEQLNGTIILLKGESDGSVEEVAGSFEDLQLKSEGIYVNSIFGKDLVLCHWPMEAWPGKHYGAYHFHGYDKHLKINLKEMNRINVCMDNWSLTPQKVDGLFELFDDYKKSKSKKKTEKAEKKS